MNITGNLGLTIWDQLTDRFDYGQLEDNWIAIDTHDHSPEHGVQISTDGLADLAVTQAKLADGAVGTVNIQDGAVGTDQLADDSVTGAKIAPGSIVGSDLQNNTITYQQLDPNVIPLGTVITWYRAPNSAAQPGGVWEIMDGRAWSSITNNMGSGGGQLSTGYIPNMIDAFAFGASLTPVGFQVGVGVTGGSSTYDFAHAHFVDCPPQSVPPHVHGISNDGLHRHTFAGGDILWSRKNAIPAGQTLNLLGPNNAQIPVNSYTAFVGGLENPLDSTPGLQQQPLAAQMDQSGTHDHGGTTGATSMTTGGAVGSTDTQLSATTTILPPYVGLLFLMKVRTS